MPNDVVRFSGIQTAGRVSGARPGLWPYGDESLGGRRRDGTEPLGAPASNGASGRHAAGQGNHAGSATHSGTRDLDAIACAGDAVLRLRIRHVPALVSAFDLRRTRICTTPDQFDLRETGRCRHPRSPHPFAPTHQPRCHVLLPHPLQIADQLARRDFVERRQRIGLANAAPVRRRTGLQRAEPGRNRIGLTWRNAVASAWLESG